MSTAGFHASAGIQDTHVVEYLFFILFQDLASSGFQILQESIHRHLHGQARELVVGIKAHVSDLRGDRSFPARLSQVLGSEALTWNRY
jgi:hypothetical protein